MNTQAPSIETFFDAPTSTLTYVVFDAASKDAVVVDPVRDFDPASGKVSFAGATVIGDFMPRGGIPSKITARYVRKTKRGR